MSRPRTNRRIRLLLAVFALAFAGLVARAVWLQGVRASSLDRLAAGQHRQTVTLPAGRGTIYDRTGVQLAIGEQATTVWADTRDVRSPRLVARAAAQALGVSANRTYRSLLDRSHGFYVARKADPAKAAALARRDLPGLAFYPEERRFYPQRSAAAQVLGYAGEDNKGLSGLELGLDRMLSGRPGVQTIIKDPFGRAIDVVGGRDEQEGKDVILTLDNSMQVNAERVLRDTVKRWRAKSATATVLDPHSGRILAMAVQPGFDVNRFGTARPDLQRNRAVTDTYEPGSTFKLVTVAAALSMHEVTPRTSFRLPYSIQVADRVIHDAEFRGTERMSVARILSHSSNVGAITLAQRLGKASLSRWISRFGFGRKTGIDYPGEVRGFVLRPGDWSGSTIGTVPIGQGIAVTPVQMASAYAAIGNGGVQVQPHLVDRVAGRRPVRPVKRRIVSRAVAKSLVGMLRNVVAEGTGTLAAVPGYEVAGKTGTAQKPDASGGYSRTKYVASFVGMVPARSPKLVILVTVDEPKGQIWGGVVAAPAFRDIALFDLQYLEVPPSHPATAAESVPAG